MQQHPKFLVFFRRKRLFLYSLCLEAIMCLVEDHYTCEHVHMKGMYTMSMVVQEDQGRCCLWGPVLEQSAPEDGSCCTKPCWISSGRRESTLQVQRMTMKEQQKWSFIWTDHSPAPCSPVLGGEKRQKRVDGERCFLFAFSSHCSRLLLATDNKLHWSPHAKSYFAHSSQWWEISLSLSQPTILFFSIFSPFAPMRMREQCGEVYLAISVKLPKS